MTQALRALIERRRELVERSGAQRDQLRRQVEGLGARLWPLRRGYRTTHVLRSAPITLGLGLAVLMLAGPRRTLRWLSTGLTAISLVRRFAALLR